MDDPAVAVAAIGGQRPHCALHRHLELPSRAGPVAARSRQRRDCGTVLSKNKPVVDRADVEVVEAVESPEFDCFALPL